MTAGSVVLVLLDDCDARLLAETRTHARLAAEGTVFPNHVLTTPVCGPSRVSILSGRYAHNHGATSNEVALDVAAAIDDTFLPTWLPAHRTALMGKYLNGYGGGYVPPGWDRWLGKQLLGYYDYKLFNGTTSTTYGHAPADYATDVLAARAATFLTNTAGPFFLMLCFNAPHGPFDCAPRHATVDIPEGCPRLPNFDEPDVSDKPVSQQLPELSPEQEANLDLEWRARRRQMLAVDEALDTLIPLIDAKGATLLLTSDNGYLMGVHRRAGGKGPVYEEGITVPLYVRGPAVFTSATDFRLVANIDLAPTVADLCGAPVPVPVDGMSLRPLLDQGLPPAWRSGVLVESAASYPAPYVAYRTPSTVYVRYEDGSREFYDLATDPYQLTNTAPALDVATVAEYEAAIDALLGEG